MEDQLKVQGINSKGFGTIPKLLTQDRNICIGAKGLYAYFCSYAGAGDACFPTRKKICYDLNISNDTLGKYLKNLVRRGYIEVEQIKENGRFSHNVYTLCSTIPPCPKISDTENTVSENSVYEKMDTNNNSTKINNSKNNIINIYNDHFSEKNNLLTQKDKKDKTSKNRKVSEMLSYDEELDNSRLSEKSEAFIKNSNNVNNADNRETKNKKAPQLNEKQLKDEFNELWTLYPKKQGKKAAFAAFCRARKNKTSFETIITGLRKYLDYIESSKKSQEFIKHGSTFFAQEAWEDDYNCSVQNNTKREQPREYTPFDIDEYIKKLEEDKRAFTESQKNKDEE